MTFLQIKYALAIADSGSMSKAAERLYVSQPTLTSAVQQLESEIGISIFRRTSRGAAPTNQGLEFLQHIRQIQEQYNLIEQKYMERQAVKPKFGVSSQHYSFVDKAFVEMVRKLDSSKYDFALRETRTLEVIQDVGGQYSEIGILFRNDLNRRMITRLLQEQDLVFEPLIACRAYVYLWKGHPLAGQEQITFQELEEYPCLVFEQGLQSSVYLAEELLAEREYRQLIHVSDRATMLNLMVGLNGYTLCSGILCEELNGTDYTAVPYLETQGSPNGRMEIGCITKRNHILSEVGALFLAEIRAYLQREPLASG